MSQRINPLYKKGNRKILQGLFHNRFVLYQRFNPLYNVYKQTQRFQERKLANTPETLLKSFCLNGYLGIDDWDFTLFDKYEAQILFDILANTLLLFN